MRLGIAPEHSEYGLKEELLTQLHAAGRPVKRRCRALSISAAKEAKEEVAQAR
jgi:hypothetical protein